MESKLRHDLRHPVATISMIASTVAAFGDGIDRGTLDSYVDQVRQEMSRMSEMVQENGLDLDLSSMMEAVSRFCQDPSAPGSAQELDACAARVIQGLTG